MYDLSIIIPCKAWLRHLKITVPRLINLESSVRYRILVVDYGCPEGTFDWIKSQNHPNLHCLRVCDNTEFFNLSRCRNIGIKHCNSNIIAFLDGDVIPPINYISKALNSMSANNCEFVSYASDLSTAHHVDFGLYACDAISLEMECFKSDIKQEEHKYVLLSSFVSKRICEEVLGYDEDFKNWSYEDVDFRKRIIKAGHKNFWIGGDFQNLHTTEEESSKFFVKNRHDSQKENLAKTLNELREVNANGYGIAKNYDLFET